MSGGAAVTRWIGAAAGVLLIGAGAHAQGRHDLLISAENQIGLTGHPITWRLPDVPHVWDAPSSPANVQEGSHIYQAAPYNAGPVCLWTTQHRDSPNHDPGASGRTMKPGQRVRIDGWSFFTHRQYYAFAAPGPCSRHGIAECRGVCGWQ